MSERVTPPIDARHVLLDLRVFAQQAEAAAVVVELRREAQPLAVGERGVVRRHARRGVDAIGEDALLAGRAIGGQGGVGGGAVHIHPGRADAESQSAQVEVARIGERLEEHARGVVAGGVHFDVGRREVVAALAVGDAVEVAHLVGERAAR